jgi:hypothetical protein
MFDISAVGVSKDMIELVALFNSSLGTTVEAVVAGMLFLATAGKWQLLLMILATWHNISANMVKAFDKYEDELPECFKIAGNRKTQEGRNISYKTNMTACRLGAGLAVISATHQRALKLKDMYGNSITEVKVGSEKAQAIAKENKAFYGAQIEGFVASPEFAAMSTALFSLMEKVEKTRAATP